MYKQLLRDLQPQRIVLQVCALRKNRTFRRGRIERQTENNLIRARFKDLRVEVELVSGRVACCRAAYRTAR